MTNTGRLDSQTRLREDRTIDHRASAAENLRRVGTTALQAVDPINNLLLATGYIDTIVRPGSSLEARERRMYAYLTALPVMIVALVLELVELFAFPLHMIKDLFDALLHWLIACCDSAQNRSPLIVPTTLERPRGVGESLFGDNRMNPEQITTRGALRRPVPQSQLASKSASASSSNNRAQLGMATVTPSKIKLPVELTQLSTAIRR